jgi:cytidylate kinase
MRVWFVRMPNLYDRLVNKVIRSRSLWRVDRVDTESLEGEPIERFTKPFITISREPGSGGKPVAKLLAKQLKFSFYDKRIIEDVAKTVRQRKALLESVDERGRSAIEDIIHGAFNPDYVSDVQYINHLGKVILSAAIKGEVVILGRGANFITPFNKGLHVRIGAPYPIRLERAVKYEKISRAKAVRVIKEVDSRRKEFIRQYFEKDITNPYYYDLVINTADMSIEDTAEHVVLALKNKFPKYAKKRKKLFEKLILTF